jgi:hypothetical protein
LEINSNQENTKAGNEEAIEILSDTPDSYDEDYKIGYDNYLKTLKQINRYKKRGQYMQNPTKIRRIF